MKAGFSTKSTPFKRLSAATPWALTELEQTCNDQVDTKEIKRLPQVASQDVEVLGLLGEGGFSTVYKVQVGEEMLALKRLRQKRVSTEEDLLVAATDLCFEAKWLSKVDHPHVLALKGVCAAESFSASFAEGSGYFLLLELLEETLADRLKKWRHQQGAGLFQSFRRSSQQAPVPSLRKRIEIGIPLAEAVSYLHEQGIILRDIKPQNVGFTPNGTLKLFDLGMARPMDDCDSQEVAGTWRYMSPEMILGPKVGLKTDVYSLGVVLWELCTLQKPFQPYFTSQGKLIRRDQFTENVAQKGWRPSLAGIPDKAARRLIEKCWETSPRARPTVPRVWLLLSQIHKDLCKQSLVKHRSKQQRHQRRPGRSQSVSAPKSRRPVVSEGTDQTSIFYSDVEISHTSDHIL